MPDEEEVIDRTRVGDDEFHPSQSETAQVLHLAV